MTLPESLAENDTDHIVWHELIHLFQNALWAKKVSTTMTLDDDYSLVIVDSTSGIKAITLPLTTDDNMDGWAFFIKRYGSYAVTISTSGGDEFDDGTTTKTLSSPDAAMGLVSVGDDIWYVTGERGAIV